MAEPCRLLIVDDHAMFRQGLRALLEEWQDLLVVGEAGDGHEALRKARELHPDIVLMDIQMPVCDGLKATAMIRQELPQVKVIILTVHGSDPDLVYEGLKAGALGYMPKLGDIDDLVKTIRLVAEGQAAVASASLTSLVTLISSTSGDEGAGDGGHASRLSAREQEVLDLVAEGCSNREIAERLCISESTVHSHLHNILDKLNLANRVQAAAYALTLKQAALRNGQTLRSQPLSPMPRSRQATKTTKNKR